MSHDVPTLTGERVVLRPLRPSDQDDWLVIERDEEFVRLNGGDTSKIQPKTEEEARRWYASFPDSLKWAIAVDGRLVGGVRLDNVNPVDRRASVSIGIYAHDARDRGYGADAMRLVLRHAFGPLELHRVDLRVLAFNARAIHLYRKLGFVDEGVERESAYVGGEWVDDLRMSLLAREWQEI